MDYFNGKILVLSQNVELLINIFLLKIPFLAKISIILTKILTNSVVSTIMVMWMEI